MAEGNAGSGTLAAKGEKSQLLLSLCASESVIVHSGPKPRSVLAVDAYVSVVLAKTETDCPQCYVFVYMPLVAPTRQTLL